MRYSAELTSRGNRKLLISITSASELRGHGTRSDTQNTLGAVKPRDLPGLAVPGYVWSESGEHPGRFGVPTRLALVPRRCRQLPDRDAGTAEPRPALTHGGAHRRHKKVLSYSDLPRRKQDWQRSLRNQLPTSQTPPLIML